MRRSEATFSWSPAESKMSNKQVVGAGTKKESVEEGWVNFFWTELGKVMVLGADPPLLPLVLVFNVRGLWVQPPSIPILSLILLTRGSIP